MNWNESGCVMTRTGWVFDVLLLLLVKDLYWEMRIKMKNILPNRIMA